MSRIGKKPVEIPSGVKVTIQERTVAVRGPKGELRWTHPDDVCVEVDDRASVVRVARESETRFARAMHGTARALVHNMVVGVSQGYSRQLELYGTGYSCQVQGKSLRLVVGFAHPVDLPIPPGVEVEIEVPAARGNDVPAKLTVRGIDKQVVGHFCRTIHDVRPPEPYLGKGIRYAGEQIRRKAGKAFAGAGAG
jgi:large subunit ribosomal protein L6